MQATLEQAIAAATQENVRVAGSGRTDAGAHALRQIVAFSTSCSLPPEVLGRAINEHLPDDIAVTSVAEVAASFHPRYDASRRVYRYQIWNRPVRSPFWVGRAAHVKYPLDQERMNEAAAILVGEHDFSSFVPAILGGSRTREVYRAECWRSGHLVIVELEGTGFMRQMIRSIVGTLVRVGAGKMEVAELSEILASRDRALAGNTMPAAGLYLMDVIYPESPPRDGAADSTGEQPAEHPRSGQVQEQT